MPMSRAPSSDRTSSLRYAVFVLTLVALVGATLPGSAQVEEPSTAAVELVLVGEIGHDVAFTQRVTSWFDPNRFLVTVRRIARLDPSAIFGSMRARTVRVWVLLRGATQARLYFACTSSSETEPVYLVRDLELESGLGEVGAENIAQVLHLSALALLQGNIGSGPGEMARHIGDASVAEPEPTLPSAEASAALAEPRVEPSLAAGEHKRALQVQPPPNRPWVVPKRALGSGVSLRGSEGVWHGPLAGLSIRTRNGLGTQLLAQGNVPSTHAMGPIRLEFYGLLLAFTAGYRRVLGQHLALEAILGPALDVVRYRPVQSLDSTLIAANGETDARPGFLVAMSAVLVRSSTEIAVGVRALIPFAPTHYVRVEHESRHVIGQAVPVVPSLTVAAGF